MLYVRCHGSMEMMAETLGPCFDIRGVTLIHLVTRTDGQLSEIVSITSVTRCVSRGHVTTSGICAQSRTVSHSSHERNHRYLISVPSVVHKLLALGCELV